MSAAAAACSKSSCDEDAIGIGSLHDDVICHILEFSGGCGAASLGSTCQEWKRRLFYDHSDNTNITTISDRVWLLLAQRRWGNLASVDNVSKSSQQDIRGDNCEVNVKQTNKANNTCNKKDDDAYVLDESISALKKNKMDDNDEKASVAAVHPKSSELILSPWYCFYKQRVSFCWTDCSRGRLRCRHLSPLRLVQENYYHEPWKLLASCILCSRTSGSSSIRECVEEFFTRYPTPTDIIRQELSGDINSMSTLLHPLGLNREHTIIKFAKDFLNTNGRTPPSTSSSTMKVTDLYGCGAFAASSHAVFCRNDYKSVLRDKKADRNVKAYASFWRKFVEGGHGIVISTDDDSLGGKTKKHKPKTQARKNTKRQKVFTKGTRRSLRQKSATAS